MKAFELYNENHKPCGIWACGECRIVHRTQSDAEQCCQPYQCTECGVETRRYWTLCDPCRSKRAAERDRSKWAAAKRRMPLSEWDGPVCLSDSSGPNDGYFSSVDDLLDWVEDDEIDPSTLVIFGTRKHPMSFDALDLIEDALQDQYEDARDEIPDGACAELQEALDAWLAKYGTTSYMIDYDVALVWEGEPVP